MKTLDTHTIRQAVILAGGEGARLRPFTLTAPKPMIRIHGKPFAEYLVDLLKKNHVKEMVFLTGYRAEQFPEYFGDGSRWGLTIRYSESPVEDDTGVRLRKAKHLLDEKFLLMYGDNYWPLNLDSLYAFHVKTGTEVTVTVYERSDPTKKNNMRVNSAGQVELYDKKRVSSGCNGVDIGFFIFTKRALEKLPPGNVNLEKELLPPLIERRQLGGFLTRQPYCGLTDAERLPSVLRMLDPSRKVLFLDRDGVINKKATRGTYITSWEGFQFLPGAVEKISRLAQSGYELYVISNQAGIARGVMTESDLADIHARMIQILKESGMVLAGIYYCPHGWDEGCVCRKPLPGLFHQAAREHDIDLTRALFIGDDERDVIAGNAAGIRTILVPDDVGIAAAEEVS